eukprot:1143838-Pelagomonas_calceolata.AAC.1
MESGQLPMNNNYSENHMIQSGMPPCQNALYFEQQGNESYHCQVHAIINVLRACIVTPESLKHFISIQHRNYPSLGWLYAYEPGIGFSDDAPIQWLLSNNLCQPFGHSTGKHICTTLDLHAQQHGCDAFLCHSHHHAFAIKKFEGHWKLLDSLKDSPINLSSTKDLRPFTTFKLSLINSDATVDNIPISPPYMEKQEKAFCLVHSFNMAIGEHIISGKDILSHICQMENTLVKRNLQKQINLNQYYTRRLGNFNITVLNHYLSKLPWNQDKNLILQQAHPHCTTGQITKNLIEGTLCNAAYKDAVILAIAHTVTCAGLSDGQKIDRVAD